MKDKATGKERLYMAVTKDRLSLPLAVADSAADEARKNLVEEAADVYNVLGLLLDAADNAEIYSIIRRKKERWLNRLEG